MTISVNHYRDIFVVIIFVVNIFCILVSFVNCGSSNSSVLIFKFYEVVWHS